jgi:hypothetical protein
MTLLGTLTNTGATRSLTNIPDGYRALYIEFDNVGISNNRLQVALSSTNGVAYGVNVNVSNTLGWGNGSVWIENIGSTVAAAKIVRGTVGSTTPADSISTNTAAPVNAIRFKGESDGNFGSNPIRIYGVK